MSIKLYNPKSAKSILECGEKLLNHSQRELHSEAKSYSGRGGFGKSVDFFHYEYEPTFVPPLWSILTNWYNTNHRYHCRTFAQILLSYSVDASTHLSNNTHYHHKYNTPSTLACRNVSRHGHTGNQQIGQVLLDSHSQQATLPWLLFP